MFFQWDKDVSDDWARGVCPTGEYLWLDMLRAADES